MPQNSAASAYIPPGTGGSLPNFSEWLLGAGALSLPSDPSKKLTPNFWRFTRITEPFTGVNPLLGVLPGDQMIPELTTLPPAQISSAPGSVTTTSPRTGPTASCFQVLAEGKESAEFSGSTRQPLHLPALRLLSMACERLSASLNLPEL